MGISYYPEKKLWILDLDSTSYAMGLDGNGALHHLYWGRKLPRAGDYPSVPAGRRHSGFDFGEGFARLEYPAWGGTVYAEPCLKAELPGGVRVLSLQYAGHEAEQDDAGAPGLVISLADRSFPDLAVKLHYRAHEAYDLIEKYAEIVNAGERPVTLESALSGQWTLPEGKGYRLTHLTGVWAGEMRLRRATLTEGKKVIESRRGTTGMHANPWFAVDRGDAQEESGDVWFGALAWSGNWKITAEQSPFDRLTVSGGVNDFDFSWRLTQGESFRTPAFLAGFTEKGFGEASRLLHRYQRELALPRGHAGEPRRVLYNSWEATGFDVNARDQMALAEKAAAIGVELFVIDDGWFGQRSSSRAGLGDWYVNQEKFPDGLKPLIDRVKSLGMAFGLWVEPEMVNPDSDLYRAHPDWVYHFPGVPRTQARNQLVLNLAREDVQAFAFEALDRLLSDNDISFIKWDMNRHFTEPGWPDAPEGRQREIWVRHTLAVYSIIDRLRARHPRVVFESCSGGGGRVDMGILRRADQFWPSDNTDAFDRLRIQEGFTQAYCPKTMSCWVTDIPSGINDRRMPLAYRFHSAMTGVLGIGGDLKRWTEGELAEAREHIAFYKRIRETVQEGALYRLLSPTQGGTAAFQYLSRDGGEAVVFVFLHASQDGPECVTLRLRGLRDGALYDAGGEILSGAALMYRGLNLEMQGDYQSRALVVRALPNDSVELPPTE